MQRRFAYLLDAVLALSLPDALVGAVLPPQTLATIASFSYLLNDLRVLLLAQPTPEVAHSLVSAVRAAARSPLVLQSGVAARLLLGPAVQALQDMAALAAGDAECGARVETLQRSLLLGVALEMWNAIVPDAGKADGTGAMPLSCVQVGTEQFYLLDSRV